MDDDGQGSATDCNASTPAFTTIGAAISAASTGDTVQVCPGTYVENIDFAGKAITVRSTGGPTVTAIDGNRAESVVIFATGEGRASRLEGFTIKNGRSTFSSRSFSDGGGIWIRQASPTIVGNIVTDNEACAGAGISVNFGSPLIQSNTISGNRQWSGCSGGTGGAGIKVGGAASAEIIGNVISNNTLTSAAGGGISLFAAGTPTIKNNVISGNAVSGLSPCAKGGGIAIVNVSDAEIVQNVIVGNSAGCGGGIAWLVPSSGRGPRLVNNTIADNNSPIGSGIHAEGFQSQAELINNIVVARPGQTAVHCGTFTSSTPVFESNDVFSSGGIRYGGNCTDQTGVNGNISADPLFVNPAAGDYHLQSTSPAIDAGDNSATGLPPSDIDGQLRIMDGDNNGTFVVDIGADEFSPAASLFTDRTTFIGAAGPLTLVDFDRNACGQSIDATSGGVLAASRYAAVGVTFAAGVIVDTAPFGGAASSPNVISNTQLNTPTPALVAGSFASPVRSVGITNVGAEAVLRIFDAANALIAELRTDTNVSALDFVGVISPVPIVRFEFDFVSGLGFGGDDLLFTTIATPDCTAPVLSVPAPITVNATSASGAAVSYTASATDNIDPNPTVSCTPPSGSTFPIGTTTVSCTATDSSGNSATKTFSVTVKGAASQLGDLQTQVQNFSPAGIANSLTKKLQHALAALNAGDLKKCCNMLDAFIHEVSAQSGKKIPAAQANALIAEAMRIKGVIGCP